MKVGKIVEKLLRYTPYYYLYVVYRRMFVLKGRSICLLGMPDSGKTRILRVLQGKEYNEAIDKQTPGGGEPYESFDCILSDEICLFVKEGRDINGDEVNIKQYYKDFINNCDTVLFVFNIHKFLTNEKECEKTKDRFDHVKGLIKNTTVKELAFIGTHLDLFKDKSEKKKAIDKFLDRIKDRQYSDMFRCLMAIDATNTTNVKREMCKIFKSQ